MATTAAPVPAPAPEEVQRIVAVSDPVRRNLEITYCYFRLSSAITRRTGQCANWCTFATWASKQAGRTIRGEDWIDALTRNTLTGSVLRHPIRAFWRALLRKGLLNPNTFLGRVTHAIHSPFDALQRASDAVVRGNLKVFEEIAYQFAVYLGSGKTELRPGPPPDGQDLLEAAFSRYTRLESESDPAARAQLIFEANLEIALHEQTRLQPEIQESLEAAPDTARDLGIRALQAIYPGAWNWNAFVQRPFAAMLAPVARSFSRAGRELTRRLITESLMTIALPSTTLALGRHVDRVPAASLSTITDQDLRKLLARFEPCKGMPDDCGAEDWAALDERMHYVVHFFRAFHELPELLESPFTPQQTESLTRGLIPAGRL